ncbi:SDR family oxidoreductase [Streptomyces cinnabarinus]|uniref:SDR family oxidoreductase n=1 Tax=Streptomyces cinnabarinus TaxID=67287 RepID=A0ABY7KFN7_9ACTN|nr:SDR family NAD(P)-dependent oxidoreductase [Streptomyces cinnabarinus]WAZ22898.1 SDR family oxidoreductase [Streptomyces cinnabarinus]
MRYGGLLQGKHAFITGASSGIGAAAARVYCREGAAVTLAARREERLAALVDELRGQGFQAQYVVVDVARNEQVAEGVAQAVERFGSLDVAFNNAGVAAAGTPMHTMSDEVYDTVMDTNVRGMWNCLRHEIAAMLEHGGAIVNTSSTAGLVATPVAAPYIAAKHAVIGLTKAVAAEYAARGIRVNVILPGATHSDMTDAWMAQVPGVAEELVRAALLPRIAVPEEIAEAAAWLSSDRASFVVGATVPVDGGWTVR